MKVSQPEEKTAEGENSNFYVSKKQDWEQYNLHAHSGKNLK